jgi:hypothetical protein
MDKLKEEIEVTNWMEVTTLSHYYIWVQNLTLMESDIGNFVKLFKNIVFLFLAPTLEFQEFSFISKFHHSQHQNFDFGISMSSP